MIPLLLFVGLIAWGLAQTRASRKVVWALRFQRLALYLIPVVRHIAADVRATRDHFRVWRLQRRVNKRWDW